MKFENIKICNQNNEGNGIAKIDNVVTFIPYTLNKDLVDIKITKQKKNYNEGVATNFKKYSDERQDALCPYYFKCGGCNLMHQKYEYQLKFKINKVLNNLDKIANIDYINDIEMVSDKKFNYRNHIILNVEKDKLGFFKHHTNEIVDIDKCIISNDKINDAVKEIKKFITKYKNNNIKRISIKGYKELLINIISDDFKLITEFKNNVNHDSLYINSKHIDGLKYVHENLNNYKYEISCNSFFQKNTNVATRLYDYIKSLIDNNSNVLDLYCGAGSISIYISDKCKKIIGIEIIKETVDDAKRNMINNKVNNTHFICGKVENNLDEFSDIDIVIVDPPREGLHKKVIDNLITISPNKIIYISCNDTTLARDIKLLNNYYQLKHIKLFDMFPNTHHVESVVLLEKINLI